MKWRTTYEIPGFTLWERNDDVGVPFDKVLNATTRWGLGPWVLVIGRQDYDIQRAQVESPVGHPVGWTLPKGNRLPYDGGPFRSIWGQFEIVVRGGFEGLATFCPINHTSEHRWKHAVKLPCGTEFNIEGPDAAGDYAQRLQEVVAVHREVCRTCFNQLRAVKRPEAIDAGAAAIRAIGNPAVFGENDVSAEMFAEAVLDALPPHPALCVVAGPGGTICPHE
jgi:hypothetical protein